MTSFSTNTARHKNTEISDTEKKRKEKRRTTKKRKKKRKTENKANKKKKQKTGKETNRCVCDYDSKDFLSSLLANPSYVSLKKLDFCNTK